MAKTLKVSTPNQIKRLIELMEQNVHLATNFKKAPSRNDEPKNSWKEIAVILNSLGPPIRGEKEWHKVWFDLKFKVKKKLIHNKLEREAADGGSFKQKFMSESDEKVVKLLRTYETGHSYRKLFGCPQPSVEAARRIKSEPFDATPDHPSTSSEASRKIKSEPSVNDETIIDLPSSSSECSRRNSFDSEITLLSDDKASPERSIQSESTPLAAGTNKHAQSSANLKQKLARLLEKQISLQKKLYTDMTSSLKEISNQLKESCKYQRRRYFVEARKLKLKEMKLREQRVMEIRKNKIKMMELDIRRRELDFKEMQWLKAASDSSS